MPIDLGAPRRVAALVVGIAILVYLNSLGAGFTFDDGYYIRDNPLVTGKFDLFRVLATPTFPGVLHRPLTVLTYVANEATAPGAAAPFHAVNVMLHAIVTLEVFVLTALLFGSTFVAALAGLIFAVHPIHTESVASVVGRAELLAAAFGLAAVLAADPRVDVLRPHLRAWGNAASVVAFFGAIMSKESALTMLPVIVLYRVCRRGEPLIGGVWHEVRRLDWIPYALCAAVYLAWRSYVLSEGYDPNWLAPLNNPLAFVPASVRLRSALGVIWDYFGLLVAPLVLSADYSHAQVPIVTTWFDWRFLAGSAVLVIGCGVALVSRHPGVRFALLFSLVAFALTSNLAFPIGTIKAERLLYLPSVGWCLVLAWALTTGLEHPRYRRAAAAALIVMVGGYSLRTCLRNRDWESNETLYRSMVYTAPNSAKAHFNYAVTLNKRAQLAAAVREYQIAYSIYPQWGDIPIGIGNLLFAAGRSDEALAWYQRPLAGNPNFPDAHTNICVVYLSRQQYEQSLRACRKALVYTPTDANLLKGVGMSYIGLGEAEKGATVLRWSLSHNPKDATLATFIAELENKAAVAPAQAESGARPEG